MRIDGAARAVSGSASSQLPLPRKTSFPMAMCWAPAQRNGRSIVEWRPNSAKLVRMSLEKSAFDARVIAE
jgi:hypothetical protein